MSSMVNFRLPPETPENMWDGKCTFCRTPNAIKMTLLKKSGEIPTFLHFTIFPFLQLELFHIQPSVMNSKNKLSNFHRKYSKYH